MTKNRIGLSNETIWKSRWTHAFNELKNQDNFVLKNGYPVKSPVYSGPPSYRESYSNVEEHYQQPKPKHEPPKPKPESKPPGIQRVEKQPPRTSEKAWKEVGTCLRCTNLVMGIMIIISLILSVIGTATPYWFETGSVNVGLFQSCTKSSTCEPVSSFTSSASETTPSTWLIATILSVCGCCILFFSTIFYCFYVHWTSVDYRKASCGVLLSIFVLLGGTAMLGGLSVMLHYYFDIGQTYTFDWSYYVAASGGGLAFITFNVIIVFSFILAFE